MSGEPTFRRDEVLLAGPGRWLEAVDRAGRVRWRRTLFGWLARLDTTGVHAMPMCLPDVGDGLVVAHPAPDEQLRVVS